MIKTLAKITSHTAKGIYAFLLLQGGTSCRKELLEAGYSSSVIHEAIISLEAAGFIIKISGMYKVTSSRPQEDSSRPQQQSSRPQELLRKPVNVNVNVKLTNKQTNGVKIRSTDEIYQFVDEIKGTPQGDAYTKLCFIYEKMLHPIMPEISRDLIYRITLAEEALGDKITLEKINEWKREAIKAEQEHRVKKAYMAFSKNVKTFYEGHKVEWTKCRPNNIRQIELDLEKAKQAKIKFLNSQVTVNGKETNFTVANLISGGQVDKISIEDAKRQLEADDPPYKMPKPSKKAK